MTKIKYSKISLKKRQTLIQLIQVEKEPIKKAAQKLKIKYETAKVIIRKYRTQGHIFKRKNQQTISQNQPNLHKKISETESINNGIVQSPLPYHFFIGYYPITSMFYYNLNGSI